MQKNSLKYFSIILLLFFTGCSTEKNTLLRRGFHNLTAKYNIYFNGYESYKKGIKKQESAFIENYAKILPFFIYPTEENVGTITPDMERAIKKSTKVISVHSITAKPKRKNQSLSPRQKRFYSKKEYNQWVDDAYLLIAKSNFYKRDFLAAEQTLNYVITNNNSDHIKYSAYIYMLRTYIEEKKYDEALELFDFLNSDRNFPNNLKWEYNAVYADFFVKQEQFEQAIPKVKKAIEKVRKRKIKSRYTYILAQIYQETGNTKRALEQYEKVLKMNPPYEMIFNAKINRATLLDVGSGKSREIKKELKKMLKDDKNKEFLDQIYYALGKIALKENELNKAIDFFKKSSSSSIENNTQKVMSYLTLADIYFNIPKYPLAKAYYDSSVSYITSDYPNYDEILSNTRILNELVTSLNTIFYEDSVQKVARMPEEERNKLIDKLINDAIEEERLKQEMIEQQRQNQIYSRNINDPYRNSVTGTGKWYFYNPSAKGFGQNEFERIWGKRNLEDNWRRKNKQTIDVIDDAELLASDSATVVSEKDKYKKTDRNYYLADIPLTEEKLEQSNKKIAKALYNAGKVYHEKLEDNGQARITYEKLVQRFPDDENALQAYYYLYQISSENNDIQKMDYYKNIILRKYPESNIVQILTNPNYLKELEDKLKEIENFYFETYQYYKTQQYDQVKLNYQYALENYPDSYLIPKFMMLNSLSIGETTNERTFRASLNDVINAYPDDNVANKAKDIIAKIETREFDLADDLQDKDKSKDDLPEDKIYTEEEPVYSFNKDLFQYILVIAKNTLDINQIKFNLTSFIVDHYDYDDYQVSDEPLNDNFQNILIKEFENVDSVMLFYNKLLQEEKIFEEINSSDYQLLIISNENYNVFMNEKLIKNYKSFFINSYLKEE